MINYEIMEFYKDRASKEYYKEIVNKCVEGKYVLYNTYEINLSDCNDNIFLLN